MEELSIFEIEEIDGAGVLHDIGYAIGYGAHKAYDWACDTYHKICD